MNLQEIFRIVRFFFSRIGRFALRIGRPLVLEALKNPEVVRMSDDERRKWVSDQIVNAIVEEFGDNIPGLRWYANFAIEILVGWLREQIRERGESGH